VRSETKQCLFKIGVARGSPKDTLGGQIALTRRERAIGYSATMRRLAVCVLGIGVLAVSCGKDNGLLPYDSSAAPVAARCTGAPVIETDAKAVIGISANADMTCESVDRFFPRNGEGLAGESCGCRPDCAPCPNGTSYALVAWCNHGKCAAPGDVACMVAGTPALAGCSPP
jgi:hypothetical protein